VSAPLDAFLAEEIDRGAFPGAVYAVAGRDGSLDEGVAGLAVATPVEVAATLDTVYDLASLTKPLVSSLLYLALRNELDLDPDAPVRRFLPEIDRMDKRDIHLRHLLTHTSGLPDWLPLYLEGRSMEEYLDQLRAVTPLAPPGRTVVYSDLGYIMLGEILTRAATMPLDRLASQIIFQPLGLGSTTFNPPAAWRDRVAATEDSCEYERILAREVAGEKSAEYKGFRLGIVHGAVHDQNAWAVGGVAGHAGLFSTAREVAAIARLYLVEGLVDSEGLALARTDAIPGLHEARSFAFRLALRGNTAAGPALPGESFGHNGFTGTSVWIDPRASRIYVLLSNRVHPAVSEAIDMVALRRRFHQIARSV
jgi:CubicO group peptidase (beta-lactamase class C family)